MSNLFFMWYQMGMTQNNVKYTRSHQAQANVTREHEANLEKFASVSVKPGGKRSGPKPILEFDSVYIPQNPENEMWDAIIIGTGMGGGTIGYELAKKGHRVLFLEKGKLIHLDPNTDYSPESVASSCKEPNKRLQFGHWPFPIEGTTSFGDLKFYAPLGCGIGGSTLLYAAALERFHPLDFTPKANYPDVKGSSLPEKWPITYDELLPYYKKAEELYCVHGTKDPLHPCRELSLSEPTQNTPRDQSLFNYFETLGLHPYHLHIGSKPSRDCHGCGGQLCPHQSKSDTAQICVIPALKEFGAKVLPECQVLELISNRSKVEGVRCQYNGKESVLSSKMVILAAGTLMTPTILLNSKSTDWPKGLANHSDYVGRNLMVHAGDFMAIRPDKRVQSLRAAKTLALNDFYFVQNKKLGTFQSLGVDLNWGMILGYMHRQAERDPKLWKKILKPFFRPVSMIASCYFNNAAIFATIIEDLPYLNNRVIPDCNTQSGMRFHYHYTQDLKERTHLFRSKIQERFGSLSIFNLSSENNLNFGHLCGTCRFGDHPKTSVLDKNNKAHDLDNLYIVDASFFPSSGGTNPSLTIAANAIRVSEKINQRL